MKRVLLILGIIISISNSHADILTAEKILDNVDDLYRSNASHGIITLSVTTVNWQNPNILSEFGRLSNTYYLELKHYF